MALGRLSALGVALVASAAVISACRTRSVYLVPAGEELRADAGHGGGTVDSGLAHTDSGPWFRADSGRPSCETSRYGDEPQPLAVYIMVDQSSQMTFIWSAMSGALSQFIQQSENLGNVSLGIKYYPVAPSELEVPQTFVDVACVSDTYAKPNVAIAPLPGNTQALLDSVSAHQPSLLDQVIQSLGGEIIPMEAAVSGAVTGAKAWIDQNAAVHGKAVVLLVTSGLPVLGFHCPPTVDAVSAAAAAGFSGTPSVPTYVLDVGTSSHDDLNAIASAGGTDHAFLAGSGADMLVALQSIRERALPCEIDVGTHAGSLDRLNVELSTSDGSTRFSKVPDGTTCDPNRNDEWSLEGTGTDAKVRLCANTCVHARSVTGARLDVVLGCRTTVD